MHIPNGFLDPKISGGMAAVAAVAIAYSLAKVRAAVTAVVPAAALAAVGKGIFSFGGGVRRALTPRGERQIYRMGMLAALIFSAQMFNFPISSGTSGHLIGGVLAAVIVGPFAGVLVVASVLLVQCFFFADGGLLALGANIVNMAVIGALVGYYIYYLSKKRLPEWLALAFAAWASVVLAALSCSLQIAFSGTIPLGQIVPAMLQPHFLIGLAEGGLTIILVNLFRLLAPEPAESETTHNPR